MDKELTVNDYKEQIKIYEATLNNLAQANANQSVTIANLQAILSMKTSTEAPEMKTK